MFLACWLKFCCYYGMCDLYLERLWEKMMANVRSIARLRQKRINKIQFTGFKLNHT